MQSLKHTHKQSRQSVKPVRLAVMLALGGVGMGQAYAGCGTENAGAFNTSLSCTPASGEANLTTQTGTNINIASSGGPGVYALSVNDDAALNINGTTLISNAGNNASGYFSVASNKTGSASINFSGDNTVLMNSVNSGSAVEAISGLNQKAGNTSIDVTGALNITNNGLIPNTVSVGVLARNFGDGDISINHQGSGTISTNSNAAIYAISYANSATQERTPDININVGEDVKLKVTTTDLYGHSNVTKAAIAVEAYEGNTHTHINNAAEIELNGNGIGIGAYTKGGIDIQNSGNISGINPTVNQGDFFGITVDSTGGTEAINIENSGNITFESHVDGGSYASYGISATKRGTADGSINITNHGAISTDKGSGIIAQIHSGDRSGDISVASQGSITVNEYGDGVRAENEGMGNTSITGNGNIHVVDGTAIRATSNHTTTVKYSGDIQSSGYYGNGIEVSGKHVDVEYTGQKIEIDGGEGGLGSAIESYSYGNTNILNSGDIDATNGASGINAWFSDYGDSADPYTFKLINQGNITLSGQSDRYGTGTGSAISLNFSGKLDATEIANNGIISTSDEYSYGMKVVSDGLTAGNIINNGTIQSTGQSSDGMSYTAQILNYVADWAPPPIVPRDIKLSNTGTISTQGDNAAGIRSTTAYDTSEWTPDPEWYSVGSQNIDIDNQGSIQTTGAGSHGIAATAGIDATVHVNNSGDIATHGFAKQDVNIGKWSPTGTRMDKFADLPAADGIRAQSEAGAITIDNAANITADAGSAAGIRALSDSSTVNVNHLSGQIHGGSMDGAGVVTGGSIQNIVNNDLIDALSDRAIVADANSAHGTVSIKNSAQMTGVVQAASSSVSLDNSGTWNLRNFADTDGDLSRDTLGVAVSNFGTSGNNSISNSGVIALLGDKAQATTLNNAGEYATGYAANTMALGGAAQGQILNVQSFTNSGVIDMGSANGTAGDVLVISGGSTAGSSGGGTYIANGGQVILDTVLNEGGTNSQSDMLVLDGTQLGASADKIKVNKVGGNGTQTVDNGIELVRVLDQNRSASDVFQLSDRLVSGAYEYDLYQGGVGADAGNGNWYLRSLSQSDGSGKAAPRAETGVYLRNMAAASTMFMHTLHDRLGEPQFTDQYKDGNNQAGSVWVRVSGNRTDGSAGEGAIDLSTDTSLVHAGGDLARWSSNGTDRWHFGLMGAYGQSDTDANPTHNQIASNGMRRTASGKVDGYSIGAYTTWYGNQDKPTGPYVDVWGQHAWYSNKVQGNGLNEEKYDSTGWTVSAESGYAFLAGSSNNRQWMIEPQVQLAYNSYSTDAHYEQGTGTQVQNGNTDGVIARVGTRVYSRSAQGNNGIQPFVEANWWYNNSKYDLSFNNQKVSDDTPDNTFELKAGLQGEISKGWQVWGHIGSRWGANSYNSYGGMVGVKHQF